MVERLTALPVVETFLSIQGESTHAGRQCFFIRLGGCNLRCTYCDTEYAQSESAGSPRTIDSLTAEVISSGVRLVELTGGEPVLHPGLPDLAAALLAAGCEVLLETNGSLPLDKIPGAVKKIVDVKLPSSGMSDRNRVENYGLLKPGDELKFVTGTRADFDFALAWIARWRLEELLIPLIFSPVFGGVTPAELVSWVLDSGHPALRFQLQLHKFVWAPERRGV